MSKNVLNAILFLFWALALCGVYWTEEWIESLPKIEKQK